jgi:hypothetical protein
LLRTTRSCLQTVWLLERIFLGYTALSTLTCRRALLLAGFQGWCGPMSDQASGGTSHEPNWIVKIIIGAFLTYEVTTLAGSAGAVFAFVGTGLLRMGTTSPGLIVLGIAVALLISAASFVLGVRLMLTIAIETGIVVWKVVVGALQTFVEMGAAAAKAPATPDSKRQAITVKFDSPTPAPQPTPTQTAEAEYKPSLKDRLYGLVGVCLWFLLVPKRYRRGLVRGLSRMSKPRPSPFATQPSPGTP